MIPVGPQSRVGQTKNGGDVVECIEQTCFGSSQPKCVVSNNTTIEKHTNTNTGMGDEANVVVDAP